MKTTIRAYTEDYYEWLFQCDLFWATSSVSMFK